MTKRTPIVAAVGVAAGAVMIAAAPFSSSFASASESRPHSCRTDLDAVRRVPQRIVAAWAENDANAFAAVFTRDASFITSVPNGYLRSREEIRSYMAAGFAGPLKGVRATADILDVRCVGRDSAVIVVEGGLLFPGMTEVPRDGLGRSTITTVRSGDGWAVTSYHNSRIVWPS